MCGLIETGYSETQSHTQKDFEDKEVPISVSVNIWKVEVTKKNDMVVRNNKVDQIQ